MIRQLLNMGIALAALAATTGCIETTTPLCHSGNLTDATGLEGDFQMSTLWAADGEMSSQNLSIKHIGKGKYQIGNGSQAQSVSVCQVDRWRLVEAPTQFGTYQQQILSVDPTAAISMNQMIIDQKTLKDAGIDFELVERENQNTWLPLRTREQGKSKALVIKVDSESMAVQLGKLVKPMALGMSLF